MRKKKETLWEMLQRLDEEAGQFSSHLHRANRYFDQASQKTKNLLLKHEEDLDRLIERVRKSLRAFAKQQKGKKNGNR